MMHEMMADVGDGYVAINWRVVERTAKVVTEPAHNIARMMLAIRDRTWIELPGRTQ